jgi:hypothetical protein
MTQSDHALNGNRWPDVNPRSPLNILSVDSYGFMEKVSSIDNVGNIPANVSAICTETWQENFVF